MLKRISCDFSFEDERGLLVQLVHDGWKQINVITTRKGVIRGNHYHKRNAEAFYIISGACRVTVGEESVVFRTGDFFKIDPLDMHSFDYLEDTTMVSMYSDGVELPNGSKDIYTE